MVYLLRYVWRVLLFGASYQLAVRTGGKISIASSAGSIRFYLRHRTGDLLSARDQRRRSRQCLPPVGADAGGFTGDGLRWC